MKKKNEETRERANCTQNRTQVQRCLRWLKDKVNSELAERRAWGQAEMVNNCRVPTFRQYI